ncbi:MAG: TrkH family potassium uptake protein [Pseudomonadota bacterium]
MEFRPLLYALGIMIMLLGGAMVPCAVIDIFGRRTEWPVFAVSSFAALVIGLCLYILARGDPPRTGQREAFLLTVLVWLILPLFAALPFLASDLSFTDAVFESVSGLTTTGSTVLTGLDSLPPGLLLWRAILQWIGGIGIIVTAIAILPQLRVGGMQLFNLESSDQASRFFARVSDIATSVGLVYVGLTVLCALLYANSGLEPFQAVTHAMTTMAAGGYSTHDASFGQYQGTAAPWVAIVFMSIAGLPFSLLATAIRTGRVDILLRSPELRLYFMLIVMFTAALVAYQTLADPDRFASTGLAVRNTLFNVISVMTGTGYALGDYGAWGGPPEAAFLILTFLGGCAGSAACGIKMFRIELSAKAVLAHAQKMVMRRRLAPVRYQGRTVSEDVLQSVMVFVFLYLTTFLTAATLLSLTGLDPITAISGAATSVSNVGPGLGPTIGPNGTFQTLPDAAKWVCAGAMLLGRLEFVPVFAILTRRFWTA